MTMSPDSNTPAPNLSLRRGFLPLGNLVSRYPLILLPVVAFFALQWGLVLGGFEGAHVIWSEAPWGCILTGIGIGILFGGVMTAVWWLDSSQPVAAGPQPSPTGEPYVAGWVLLCLIAMTPALVRSSLFQTTLEPLAGTPTLEAPEQLPNQFTWLGGLHRARVCLPVGVCLALLVGLVGYMVSPRFTRNSLRFLGWGPPAVVAFGYVAFSLFHWCSPTFYLPVAAPVTSLLLLGLAVSIAAALHRFGMSTRTGMAFYPVTLGVLFLVVIIGGEIEPVHKVPGLEMYYDQPIEKRPNLDEYLTNKERYRLGAGGPPGRELVRDLAALEEWQKQPGNSAAGAPVLVLTVSGGASTSAVFVARSLFRLETRFPGFINRVRVISGASGGMLGAAYFVAQFRPGSPYRQDVRAEAFAFCFPDETDEAKHAFTNAYHAYLDRLARNEAKATAAEQPYWDGMLRIEKLFAEGLEADFLSPLLQKWVHKDLNPVARFLPQETANDRGTALELAWDRHLLGQPIRENGEIPVGKIAWNKALPSLSVPFDDLREEEKRGLIPSLVFTPMLVEDGRQLIISNLDLGYMIDRGSYTPPRDPNDLNATKAPVPTYSAIEFYRLFPEAVTSFRLGTAVRMNATFPVFSPATELPTNPPRRVVDAGYYDNYGLSVASRWIESNRKKLGEQNMPVWVVQLWAYGYEEHASSFVTNEERELLKAHPDRRALPDSSLRSSTVPIGAIHAAWDSSMAFRGEERLNTLLYDMNEERKAMKLDPLGFRFRKDIGKAALPMNWVLTSESLARIRLQSREFAELADAVRDQRAQSKPEVEVSDVPPTYQAKLQGKKLQELPPSTQAGLREKTVFADKLYKLWGQSPPAVKNPAPKP